VVGIVIHREGIVIPERGFCKKRAWWRADGMEQQQTAGKGSAGPGPEDSGFVTAAHIATVTFAALLVQAAIT
jgi:hypothetical protein